MARSKSKQKRTKIAIRRKNKAHAKRKKLKLLANKINKKEVKPKKTSREKTAKSQ